jgi:hypothetical protein
MSSRFSGPTGLVAAVRPRSTGALLVLVLAIWALVPGGTRPAAATEEGLELLGRLPQPKGGIALFDAVGLEPVTRRLYLRGALPKNAGYRLLEYDLTTRIPALLRMAPLPTSGFASIISPYTVSFDPARKRAFVLDETPAECSGLVCSIIRIMNLETLRVEPQSWNLTLMVPNFYASGITYSAEDKRIYAVGSLIGYPAGPDNPTGAGPAVPVMVVAVDATSGDLVWAAPIPKCQYPAVAFSRGAAIFRSKQLSALYVPCVRPEPRILNLGYTPGTSAVVRLWIDPRAGTNDAVGFRSEIFPISGRYTDNSGNLNAMSVFDERADRVYMANNANTTSGAWVFDGLLSAWVGFVPAFDETNYEIGLDQSSGHLYMRSGQDGNLIVTDGRATPVPQGELFPIKTLNSGNFYLADPLTHRVFVRTPPGGPDQPQQMLVLEDRTPSATPAVPDDYDSLTTDVAEGTGTFSTFAGSVNGFGARITLVGGYGGAMSPVIQNLGQDPVKTANLGISPGPRGIAMGRVGSLDLQNVGASASAQAVAPDDLTDDEYETRRKNIGESGGEGGGTVANSLAWQWPAAVCLDAGDKDSGETEEASIGRSVVSCDLKQQRVSAITHANALSLDTLSVAGASFDSSVARTASEGTVTESTAVARGIEVTVPGFGRLSIARVISTVRTLAHGRPGTASVKWTRDIDGVLLTDPSGKVLFRCPDACSPKAVADAVNEAIGQRVQISIPNAERIATARGAFAGIRKTAQDAVNGLIVNDDDSSAVPALELLIINDTQDKSRLDVQLAAIQASSIYGISLLPQEGELNGPPLISVPPLVPPVLGLGPQVGPGAPPPPFGPVAPSLATTRSSVLAVRSAADALFVSLICVLIFATVAGAVRRHRFAALLNGGR